MEITLEQVERLCEKANVSYSQAKTALEHTGGDLLDALIWLEQQGQAKPPEGGGQYATQSDPDSREVLSKVIAAGQKSDSQPTFLERLLDLLKDLARRGMENDLLVTRKGEVITSVPVLIVLLLLLVSFGFALLLLAAGLLFGCRYRFTGPDLDRREVNRVMDVVNDTVNDVREQVITEMNRHSKKDKE